MDVTAILEHRSGIRADGAIWMQAMFAHPFWRPYLEVFDHVRDHAHAKYPKPSRDEIAPMAKNNSKGSLHTLQVSGEGPHRAALGAWPMRVLRRIDRERFHTNLRVEAAQIQGYEAEILPLGPRIVRGSRYRLGTGRSSSALEERT